MNSRELGDQKKGGWGTKRKMPFYEKGENFLYRGIILCFFFLLFVYLIYTFFGYFFHFFVFVLSIHSDIFRVVFFFPRPSSLQHLSLSLSILPTFFHFFHIKFVGKKRRKIRVQFSKMTVFVTGQFFRKISFVGLDHFLTEFSSLFFSSLLEFNKVEKETVFVRDFFLKIVLEGSGNAMSNATNEEFYFIPIEPRVHSSAVSICTPGENTLTYIVLFSPSSTREIVYFVRCDLFDSVHQR